MKSELIDLGFIPLDKYWSIRLGVLDIVNGEDLFLRFVRDRENLGEDIKSLLMASEDWDKKEVRVGESGTLLRFLQFASWKFGLGKKFIKEKTLRGRNICQNSEIVDWPLERLLGLDHGTSQWASASVLLGNDNGFERDNFFLKLTREALEHWNSKKRNGEFCEVRYDETLLFQAEAFLRVLKGKDADFELRQPDDYCFARTFGLISEEEGRKKWPALEGHESNRFLEMEKQIENYKRGEIVDSKDHRAIQGIAMLALLEGKEVRFEFKECVNKTWPQFWDFLDYCKRKI